MMWKPLAAAAVLLSLQCCGARETPPVMSSDAGAAADSAAADAKADQVAAATLPDPLLVEGKATLDLDPTKLQLTVWTKLWESDDGHGGIFDLSHLQFGQVAAWDPKFNYDPGNLAEHAPKDLVWWTVHSVAQFAGPTGQPGTYWRLQTQDASGKTGPGYVLHASTQAGVGFLVEIAPEDTAAAQAWAQDQGPAPVVYVRFAHTAPPGAMYFGLGEMFDTPQHRGKIRDLQLKGDFSLDGSSNEGHVRLPLLVSSEGWGWFAQTRRAAQVDVAATDPGRVTATFNQSALQLYLFNPGKALDVVGRYWKVTGRPQLPAPWALGGLLWRDENKDQGEVLQDAADLRKHDLAFSGMWVDRPYDVAVNDFGFEPKQFPDPKAMIDALHSQGLRLGLWSTPYLDPGYGGKPKAQLHDEATAKDYFVHGQGAGSTILKWGPPIDFSKPEADALWRSLVKKYTDLGIEGFKLDYGEDIVLGLLTVRLPWTFADGSDERTMHHGYALGYHAAYADNLPKLKGLDGGGWILARNSTWGDQVKTSIIWPGDLCSGWVKHAECTPNGKCHAGGLPASVAAAISLPTAGFPLFGADTGGYRHGRAPKELFLRWLQHTALTGVLQIGGGSNHHPWLAEPPDNDLTKGSPFDQETLDVARELIRLHARLFPLLWSDLMRTQDDPPTGVGPLRALGLQFQPPTTAEQLRGHERDEWMLGDNLLVAPVLTPGDTREVWFPPGQWLDWFDGSLHDGGPTNKADGKFEVVTAAIGKLPLYVRAGSIVPLLRPTIDTLAASSDPKVDSFANDPGLLWLTTRRTAETVEPAQLSLWDGVTASATATGKVLKLQATPGKLFAKGFVWDIRGLAGPAAVTDGAGKSLTAAASADAIGQCPGGCWAWDNPQKRLVIRVDGGVVLVTVP